MISGAWEVGETDDSLRFVIEARTDDDRHYVILLMEDIEDAEEVCKMLNDRVSEIVVKRS